MINRNDIGNELARLRGGSQDLGNQIVGDVLAVISAQLAAGNDVALFGFGKFEIVKRKAREGRNPQTGEKIAIAASTTVRFQPQKALKDILNHRPRRLKFSVDPPIRMVGADRNSPTPQRKRA